MENSNKRERIETGHTILRACNSNKMGTIFQHITYILLHLIENIGIISRNNWREKENNGNESEAVQNRMKALKCKPSA